MERGEITTADQLKEEVKALIKTAIEREREAFINHLKQLKQEIVKEVEVKIDKDKKEIIEEVWEAADTLAQGHQAITGILTHGFEEVGKGIRLSLENEYQLKRSLDELKSKLDKLHKKYEDVEQEMRDVYWELRRIGG